MKPVLLISSTPSFQMGGLPSIGGCHTLYVLLYGAELALDTQTCPCPQSNKCFPAVRLRDGTHVMLVLVCKNGEGGTELEILRRFSRPDIARHPDNHVIPLLDELRYGDMTIAVLPLLEESLVEPWFFDVQEVLDAVAQTLKVCLDTASSSDSTEAVNLLRDWLLCTPTIART